MKKIVFVTALLASSAGWAQTPSSGQTAEQVRDPDEMVCRQVEDTGSRLSRSRVCMTRAQWADYNRTTRQGVERSQATRSGRQY